MSDNKITGYAQKSWKYLKRHGAAAFARKAGAKLLRMDTDRYEKWLKDHLPDQAELAGQRDYVSHKEAGQRPRFSLIVPTYRTPAAFLEEMIDSVEAQTWTDWELCVADGSAPQRQTADLIRLRADEDPRIRLSVLDQNLGISGNTNAALSMARGEWVVLMDHDDLLEPSALFEVAHALEREPLADCLYTDEDKVDLTGGHYDPHGKPDLNPDMFLAGNYICHLFVVRKSLLDQVGLFDPACDGSQDYDIILRCLMAARYVIHLPRMLYHWRSHPASTAQASENKTYCYEAGERALQKFADARGIPVKVYKNVYHGYYHWYFTPMAPKEEPLISVILTGGDEEEAAATVQSILKASPYRNYQFLRKGDRPVGLSEVLGEYMLFVRAGGVIRPFKVTNPAIGTFDEKKEGLCAFPYNMVGRLKWAEAMSFSQTGPCGLVSGRVLDRKNTYVYAGMVQDPRKGLVPLYRGIPIEDVPESINAVGACETAGASSMCMMIKTDLFKRLGGLEGDFKEAGADSDLSLRVREAGYRVVFDPTVTLRLSKTLPVSAASAGPLPCASKLMKKHEALIRGRDPERGACPW